MNGLLCGPFMLFGQTYFQQQVDHTIDVRLDDAAHMLHGQESFVYTNNSPVTLDTLWIHLWPNAYRDRHSALSRQLADIGALDLHFATEAERGWIDSLNFAADGAAVVWGHHPVHADIGWIKLNTPLIPNGRTTITTPFRVKIPDGKFSRLGHTGQAYYITQWFPKPAVFDKDGWHAMPYLTQGEFYSEFGSYDVSITLPANYVVGATGMLQNAEEIELMDRMASPEWQYPQPLNDPRTGRPQYNTFPRSSGTMKTLRYVQSNVHDFAWFADKRFIVRSSSVVLPNSERSIRTWALFTPKNAALWENAVTYVNESVRLYSQWVGNYPYDACTAVDGTISAGGGMEYPMITIIGDMGSKESLDNVIAHEVGHNWFYGILGSNERDHAWMDEGLNSFMELRYMRERYPDGGLNIGIPLPGDLRRRGDPHHLQSELMYRLNARRNLDQPPALSSRDFTPLNYGAMVYGKTALVMDHLMAYLGEEMMDRCMHAYFEAWKFKHPQPEDVRTMFERESGKDLGWVFEEGLQGDRKVDVKAVKLKSNTLTYRTNTNGLIAFPITGWNGPEPLGTQWTVGGGMVRGHSVDRKTGHARSIVDRGKQEIELPWSTADRIRIDAGARTLDIDRRNNSVRSHGLFRRHAPLQFRWLLGVEQDDKRTVYYTPLPAWNGNDGWQLGLAAYNTTFPSQRTEWVVAPLYGMGSARWGGAARIEHHFDRIRSPIFQNISIGVSARSASTFRDHEDLEWYSKVSPYLELDLKREPLNRPWRHSLGLRTIHLEQSSRSDLADGSTTTATDRNVYVELTYRAEDARKLHPSLILPTITYEQDFLRASLEVRQAFSYNGEKDAVRLRAFVGSFLWKGDDRLSSGLHAWGLTWGTEDMLFDHAYLERNARDHFLSRQYNTQQGAFKTPFLQGGSETWIASANAELDLPLPIPLALFASAGLVPVTTITQEGRTTGSATYVEGGIGLIAIPDVLEIWFPLFVSDRIADEEEFVGRTVSDRIRFIFALEKLDPTKALRNLKP